MLEDPEVDGLLVRLNTPGDRIFPFHGYPPNKIALDNV